MRFFLLILILSSSALCQTEWLVRQLGRPESGFQRLLDANEFEPKTGRLVWHNTDVFITAIDVESPESLTVLGINMDVGLNFPTRHGDLAFYLSHRNTTNRVLTSYESDTLTFKSKTDFSNDINRFHLSCKRRFFDNRAIAAVGITPIFYSNWGGVQYALTHPDLAANLNTSIEITPEAAIEIVLSRNYYDKMFSSRIFGFAVANEWLSNLQVGSGFDLEMRNFFESGVRSISFKNEWQDRVNSKLIFTKKQVDSKAIFEMRDQPSLKHSSEKGVLSIELNGTGNIGGSFEIAQETMSGVLDLKYQRSNGSYSTAIDDAGYNGVIRTVSAGTEKSINTRHKAGLFGSLGLMGIEVPDYTRADPVKYLGVSYGAYRFKGHLNIMSRSIGLDYSYKSSSWRLGPSFTYVRNNIEGTLFTLDTWAGDRDTVNTPIRLIRSLDFSINGHKMIAEKLRIGFRFRQLLPFGIEFNEKFGTQPASAQDQESKRKIIGLNRIGLRLSYLLK